MYGPPGWTSGEIMVYGIALDVGTSGYRSHLVDLSKNGRIASTAITMHHPLPGANIMDHLHFWLENGAVVGHKIVTETIDKLIESHRVSGKKIERISVCGNPAQVSMFENIEIRDLAYAGQSLLSRKGVVRPDRKGKIVTAGEVGLQSVGSETEVVVPPAIKHEIGADALAMIIKSGLLDKKETCMVTDYGTNAEMGLYHDGELYTGSAAAGPAMEGQAVSYGMLAAPYAISDLEIANDGYWTNYVLNQNLRQVRGHRVNPSDCGIGYKNNVHARGITGTGVVAAVALGLESGLIKPPTISTPGGSLCLQDGITFSEKDLLEAGKAMGAIRAGHKTLIEEIGIEDKAIKTMYLAGASGTYVDPIKAQTAGMLPRAVRRTVQIGNTSLMLAYDLLTDDEMLDKVQEVADSIASRHIMFASSDIFEKVYVGELAYWTEGMPWEMYQDVLKNANLKPFPPLRRPKETLRVVSSDIPIIGDKGLKILENVGVYLKGSFDGCTGCTKCEKECPEKALGVLKKGKGDFAIRISTDLCLGTACKNCQSVCPQKALRFSDLKIAERRSEVAA